MKKSESICILLVEDHEDSLSALSRLLKLDGRVVHEARTAAEARSLAASNKCDIAICDLGLPDGRGTDLIRELRATYNLKSIALTGYTTAEDARDVAEAGFDAYLPKPVIFADVLKTIAKLSADKTLFSREST